jgi:serine/threonine-protein kinase
MSAVADGHRAGDRVAEKYLLLRLLEIRGMGAVWVAHHLALDVHVAIKFIRPEVASPTAAARLLREAQAAARVHHPAIVRVIDVGHTAEGETYLAMELLDGEPLAEVLDRERRLDPLTAVRVLLPIAEVLDALHRSGIIHRDVRPENIFLTRDDAGHWQPKLIDFGLARSTDPGAARLTEAGSMIGTPAYMSRERLLGEDVDAREDVYGLSVVLYHVITGELPFAGEGPVEVFSALTANCPRSTADHRAGDEELWAIVARGLACRSERWTTAWDLGRALAGWAWKNGAVDDIAGMSLRSVWIDDEEAQRLDRSAAAAPALPQVAPASPQEIALAATAAELPSRSGEIDPWIEDRTLDGVLPAHRWTRGYTALAAGTAILAVVCWSALLIREFSPETPPTADEREPGAMATGIAPAPESATAPDATSAPQASSCPAPCSSANAPADPVPPSHSSRRQGRKP